MGPRVIGICVEVPCNIEVRPFGIGAVFLANGFGSLVAIELFRNYHPIETYLNGDIFNLMEAEHGMLARGPQKLLARYAQCLEKHNVVYSMIGEGLPTY